MRTLLSCDQLRQPGDVKGVLHWILTGGGSRHWHSNLKYGKDNFKVGARVQMIKVFLAFSVCLMVQRLLDPTIPEKVGTNTNMHSNWTDCSVMSPFCCENFLPFQPSYWGAISYYPGGLIIRKENSPNSKIG